MFLPLQGTQRLLALATRMTSLKCLLHVSTAYVNVNLPKGSNIEERIYPLYIGGQEVHHADIVEDLMSLKPTSANVRVSQLQHTGVIQLYAAALRSLVHHAVCSGL